MDKPTNTPNWDEFTPIDDSGKAAPKAAGKTNWDDFTPVEEPKPRGLKGWARDAAATAVKGAIAVPEALVGLADIPTGGAVGKFLENEGGTIGFRPKQAKEAANEWHSDATKEAQRKFQEADGIVDKAVTAVQNPSLIATAVGESLPSMGLGGVAARGLMAATRLGQMGAKGAVAAGALGEGATMAGSQAEAIRQETDDGLLTPAQAGAAVATGLVGGAVSLGAGRVANKLGIGDADTMLAQGTKGMDRQFAADAAARAANPLAQQAAVKGIPRRVVEGAIAEGFLEELPQSVAEQIFQNVALGKDWLEDVDAAAVMGVLSGGAMGGGAAGFHGLRQARAGAEGGATPGAEVDQAPAVAPAGAPPGQAAAQPEPNPGLERLRSEFAARMRDLEQQEQGEQFVPQTAPPDGAAALARQQAQQRAARAAQMEADRAVESPDDEIHQSIGADLTTPSQRMGLDPAAGALSTAAAIAVDSGAHEQMQQAAAVQEAAEIAAATEKAKPKQKKERQQEQQDKALHGVDPETGELRGNPALAAWSDAQLSGTFRSAQSRDVRLQLAKELGRRRAEREQAQLQAELDAEQDGLPDDVPDNALAQITEDAGDLPAPSTTTSTTKENPDGAQADQAQQASPQSAQAGAAQAPGTQVAQEAGDAAAIERPAPGAAGAEAQAGEADAAARQGPAPVVAAGGGEAAAPGAVAGTPPAEAREQRAQRVADAGQAWARMPAAEREALAGRVEGVKPVIRKNLPRAQWESLNGDIQRKLAEAMVPKAVPAPVSLKDELGDGGGTYADKLNTRIKDANYRLMQATSLSPMQRKLSGHDVDAMAAEVASLESMREEAQTLDDAALRESIDRGMLKSARQDLDASSLTPEQREDAAQRAGRTGNAADASQTIFDAVDGATVATAAQNAATNPQNDLPEPTEAQKEAGNYRKGHVRLNGHDISIENPAGSRRRPEWPPLKNHYGYIRGSVGADKDHVDVFMTDRAREPDLPVFVVDQVNKDGSFDEHKVVMGVADEAEARATYLGNYAKGWTGLGAITQMTQDEFKAWVRDPAKTKKPAARPARKPAAPARKPRGVLAKKAAAEAAARADYFTPGNIVKGYSGHNRVISYSPPDENGRWSVTVRSVEKQGAAWVDVPGERERTHATQPDARELKAGPVVRAEPGAQPDTADASASSFPLQEAASSYAGISHSGTSRAKADAGEFQAYIDAARDAGAAVARSDAQKAAMSQAVDALRADYLAQYRRLMGVRAGTYSGFVAGRSGLNSKQADKRNSAYDRAIDTFVAWQNANQDRVRQAALDARTDEEKSADRQAAEQARAEKAQRKEDGDRRLMRKILSWKKGGEPVAITKTANLAGVNFGKDGYPTSIKLAPTDGSVLTDDKFDLAALFRERGVSVPESKRRVRELVDAVKAEDAEQDLAEPTAAETAPAEPSKTPALDAHTSLMERVREGKASADEFKASFEAVLANAEAIKAEMAGKTKAELLAIGGPLVRMRYANEKKASVVDAIYHEMIGEYALGQSFSYGMARDSYQNAVRRLVEATDADKLAQFAKDRQEAIAEAQARREANAAALQNPKTLADFRAVMRHHIAAGDTQQEGYLRMTPPQRARYDELEAESTRARRDEAKAQAKTRVASAGQTTAGEIIETTHTKHGHDLFVVQLAERVSREDYDTLNSSAKRLGGSYSSYRGNGAIPGFQFRTREAAEAFRKLVGGDTSDAQAVAAARRDAFEDDRSQSAAERLRAMADALNERAAESLGRERKANTDRRARMAASAEAAARADQALAGTMRNLAAAIEGGKAKFLDAVRQKVQVEMLARELRQAKDAQIRAKHPTYAEQERHRGEPVDAETVDFATFPGYTAMRSDLAALGRQMLETDGLKKLGARLMSVADDVSEAYTDWAKQNLLQVSRFGNAAAGGLAEFGSKDDAARAIQRAGLAGKAIVLPIKRGQNRVVLSPSEAMKLGLWDGDGDKRITLSREFGQELVKAVQAAGGRKAGDRLALPWALENAHEKRGRLEAMGILTAAEYRSALREFAGLQEAMATPDKIKEMERAMIGRRADGLDFFPTSEAVVESMLDAAAIEPGMAVLEPSAGMGHIADAIREKAGVEPDVVELSGPRRELLEAKGYQLAGEDFLAMKPRDGFTYGDVFRRRDGTLGVMRGSGGLGSNRVGFQPLDAAGRPDARTASWEDREDLEGVERRGADSGYDRIVMNPPFSKGRDIEHVRHAFELLRPGGRLVAIMGEGAFFHSNKAAEDFRAWLDELGATAEKLPDGSFMDPTLPVNTGVNARMVVIDKPAGDAVFSSTDTKPAQGISVARAREIVDGVFADFGVGPAHRAQVFTNPTAAGYGILPDGVQPSGATRQGVVQIFADNLHDDADAFKVAIHELFHLGLSKSVEQEAYIQKMLGFMADPLVRQYAKRWRESSDGVSRKAAMPVNNWHALSVEEALADLAEELHAGRGGVGSRLSDWAARMANRLARIAARAGLGKVAERIRAFTRTQAEQFITETMRRAGDAGPVVLRDGRWRSSREPVKAGEQGAFFAGERERQGTKLDQAVLDMVFESADAQDVLKLIASTSRSPFYRQISRLLIKTGAKPRLEMRATLGGKATNLGRYRRTDNSLSMTPAAEYMAEQVFLHEMVHAATLAALDRKGLVSLQMRRLYHHVQRHGGAKGAYGMKNVGEFVAEAFSNPEFQRLLKTIPAPKGANAIQNAWDGFVRILKSILGLPRDANDALSRMLELGVPLMREDRGVRQRLARVQVEQGPDADGDAYFDAATLRSVKASALDQLETLVKGAPGTVSVWHKTVGTMRNLAETHPLFKPVYEGAQQFIDDVSTLANDAADAAPRWLPRVESLKDMRKKPVSAADNRAVAKPLFEGTLAWGRDFDGKPALVEDLAKKYSGKNAAEKAQLLLAAGQLSESLLKMWQGLPLERFESNVNSAFETRALKAGVVWKDAELRSLFGLTDEQVSLYREARAGIDRSIDVTARADMLRAAGEGYAAMRDVVMDAPSMRDAMTLLTDALHADAVQAEREGEKETGQRLIDLHAQVMDRHDKAQALMDAGYAPLSRFGRFTVDVVGADGERQYFGLFETAHEARVMAAKMQGLYPEAKVGQGTMSQEAFKLFQGITPESIELFGSMLGLDADGESASDQAFQQYLNLTKNNHSALKRLIHRKGIAGFSEDVGRVLASFVYSNARQAAGGLNAGAMDNAINEIPKDQGQLRDVAMGLRQYIRDPQEEGQAVRGMLFAQYLGGSVASAMVNMTQPFQITMPWLSQYGGMAQAAAQMARAVKDMSARRGYEPDLAKALKDAEDDGTVSPQEIHQLMAQARGTGSLRSGDGTRAGDARAAAANTWERTKVLWGQPFALAEQFNRRSTFIAAFRTAVAQKMDDPAAFARRAVLETQFVYSKANKPRWARGAIGGTLFTFKTYSVSYLELMHRMWTQGGPEGKRAVAWAVAMLALMGGAGGLPFMEDAEDLIDGAGQLMGYNISAKQWRKQFLSATVGKELAEFMEQGVSGLPGAPIDVSGRLGMGNLLPGTGLFLSKQSRERDLLEVAGPAGDLVARGFTGARKLLTGDVGGAAMEISPTAVRNAAKGVDMATSGIYKDTKGYKIIDTTLGEALAKAAGFQPKSVAEVQEANSFMQRSRSFYTQTSSEIKAQWAQALFEKDEAALGRVRDRLAAWNRNNPEQPIVVKMPDIWKKVREMGKDRTQRIADTAPKALRAQMREMAQEASR